MPLFDLTGCDSCSLKKEWVHLGTPKMPMAGPTVKSDVRILVVGEAPGEQEDDGGVPFIGKSGKYLRERIPGGWADKVHWQNTVRCRPPNNRTPTVQEVIACSVHLEKDISTVRPNAILGLGSVPLSYFWSSQHITGMRGVKFPVQIADGSWTWFYSTFHPSYVGRGHVKEKDGTTSNYIEPVFAADLRWFFSNAESFLTPPKVYRPPTQAEVIIPKSKEEAHSLFSRLEEPFGMDFETYKLRPYLRDALLLSAGFSDGKLTFALPLQWPGMLSRWGMEFFVEAMKQNREWVGHNATMELPWVWYHTGSPNHRFHDTMALARLVHHRKGILELGEQTRIHLGINIKDITGVKANKSLDYVMHRQGEYLYYNGLDAWGSAMIHRDVPLPPGQLPNYKRIIDSTYSGAAMELSGLHVSMQEAQQLADGHQKQIEAFTLQAKTIPEVQQYERDGGTFSLTSPEVVGDVLVKYCGLPLELTAKGKQYSTDEQDLEKFADVPLVALTLSSREVEMNDGTYVQPILTGKILGVDNLLHPSYKPMGTITGRGASENPNIQNFPKRKHRAIRRMIVAPDGFILAAFDYGQLEARVIAMGSRDVNLCRSIIADEDIHSRWLNRCLALYPAYESRLADKTGQKEEKAIRKAGRDIIKTDFVFATFYGSQAPSVSDRTMIPLKIVEQLLDEFWNEYKGVRAWVNTKFDEYRSTGMISTLTGRLRSEVLKGNEPINTPVQGTGADIVQEARNGTFYTAIQTGDAPMLPRIDIHDDLTFLLPDDNTTEVYAEKIAQEIVKVRFPFIIVPLMTELQVGYNWCDMEKVAKFTGEYIQ